MLGELATTNAAPYNRGYDDAEVDEIQLIYQTLIKRQLIAAITKYFLGAKVFWETSSTQSQTIVPKREKL